MYNFCLKIISISILFTCQFLNLSAQIDKLNVFIDCNCDRNYIRQELSYVNHVRDQALADVQVFIRNMVNGSGGQSYELNFVPSEELGEEEYNHHFEANPTMTRDEIRAGLAKKITLGLLPFLLQSEVADYIEVSLKDLPVSDDKAANEEDPWNKWIFNVYGEGEVEKESSRNQTNFELGFSGDRVTEEWRIRGDLGANFSNSKFLSGEEEFTSRRRYQFVRGSVVNSLGNHLSAGIFSAYEHSTFRNLDHRLALQPAIEYNLFPYNEVLKREITFAYRVGVIYNDYIEKTIFGQNQEHFFSQSLNVNIRFRQAWGSLFTNLSASNFLNDFSKNRVEFNTWASVRIVKGLAVRFSTKFEFIRDQINLPAGDASLEDLLLSQRQIATDFELKMGIGLTYTFGSAFNNIVNTRL